MGRKERKNMATKADKRRAKALMQDVKDGNPQLLKELEQEGLNPEEYLEQKVETARSREEEILEVLKRDIPQGLSPLEYERELNWKRQQAQEIANEDLRSLY